MFKSFRDQKNVPVRVHVETGCDTPMMSKLWADSHGVPLVTQPEPKIVDDFNGERVQDAGGQHTFPMTRLGESQYI